MRTLTRRQLGLLASFVIGAVLMTGCVTNMAYRTYYEDSHCRIFYIDQFGNRVYLWKASSDGCFFNKNVCYQRNASGHWYYDDSFGNRFYKQHVCHHCRICR